MKETGPSDPARAERERVEHLVLGRPRPRPRTIGRGRSKREVPHRLTPEVEREVARREEFGHRQGTPQTLEHAARKRQGALARLHQSGAIDADQLAAAQQIAWIAERIGGAVALRTMSLETRVDRTTMFDAKIREGLGAVQMEMAYTRWRGSLGIYLAPMLEMIVEDRGVTIVAARHRLGVKRATRILVDALDQWNRMLFDARRMVDRASLDAAHARLN